MFSSAAASSEDGWLAAGLPPLTQLSPPDPQLPLLCTQCKELLPPSQILVRRLTGTTLCRPCALREYANATRMNVEGEDVLFIGDTEAHSMLDTFAEVTFTPTAGSLCCRCDLCTEALPGISLEALWVHLLSHCPRIMSQLLPISSHTPDTPHMVIMISLNGTIVGGVGSLQGAAHPLANTTRPLQHSIAQHALLCYQLDVERGRLLKQGVPELCVVYVLRQYGVMFFRTLADAKAACARTIRYHIPAPTMYAATVDGRDIAALRTALSDEDGSIAAQINAAIAVDIASTKVDVAGAYKGEPVSSNVSSDSSIVCIPSDSELFSSMKRVFSRMREVHGMCRGIWRSVHTEADAFAAEYVIPINSSYSFSSVRLEVKKDHGTGFTSLYMWDLHAALDTMQYVACENVALVEFAGRAGEVKMERICFETIKLLLA